MYDIYRFLFVIMKERNLNEYNLWGVYFVFFSIFLFVLIPQHFETFKGNKKEFEENIL